MAISRIGSQTGTTSLTIPAHQAGDLIVAFAFRDGSTTAPTLPSGQNWSSPSNATRAGTTCSHRTAYKIATSSSEATGTFTNATSLIVVVYRGVDKNQPIGTNTVNSGSSTSIGYAATNPVNLDGSSWLLGFCGHRSTDVTIETAPSGMTNITSVSDATDECAAHDTNAGRTTNWSATNASVGGTSSGWTSHVLEIRGERKCIFNISQLRAGTNRAGLQPLGDQFAFVIGELMSDFQPAIVTGNYYLAPTAYVGGSQNIFADSISAVPIWFSHTETWTEIGVYVDTAEAGASIRLGIWSSSGNAPGALLVDTGNLSLASTGALTATVSQSLTANTLYWIGYISNTDGVTALLTGGSPSAMHWLVGRPSFASNASAGYSKTQAFGALPNPFGTPDGAFSDFPAIWLRKV